MSFFTASLLTLASWLIPWAAVFAWGHKDHYAVKSEWGWNLTGAPLTWCLWDPKTKKGRIGVLFLELWVSPGRRR